MGRKVLVTGGAGFVGSNLVRALLARGDTVRVIDNFATGHRANLTDVVDDVEVVEGDLTSYERTHAATKGVDIVFHEAALPSVPRSVQDPLTTNAVNVTGTLNVLLCSRDEGVGRVVYASSSSVYGNTDVLPKVEAMSPRPVAPYAVAKLAGEHYCQAFTSVYGLETVSLRYFNVYGPRQDPASQYAAVIPRFIRAIAGGESVMVHGDGEQTRDFTYIDNVVSANLLAADADGTTISGEAVNVAGGEQVSVNHLIVEIGELIGLEPKLVHISQRPGDVRHSRADITKAQRVLGYEHLVGLREGLRRTIEWLT